MSLSNTSENAVLKALLQGTDPSWRAGATQYLALFTADPTESASLANEANYTGYLRVSLTKATAWTDAGSTFTNANLIQFPECTAVSPEALTYFAVVDTGTARLTAVNLMISGQLSKTLNVDDGIQPQIAAGSLSVNAD